MSSLEEYEEFDIEEVTHKPMVQLYQRSKHQKPFSDTFSTNSCTFELEKFQSPQTVHKRSEKIEEGYSSYKALKKKKLTCLNA